MPATSPHDGGGQILCSCSPTAPLEINRLQMYSVVCDFRRHPPSSWRRLGCVQYFRRPINTSSRSSIVCSFTGHFRLQLMPIFLKNFINLLSTALAEKVIQSVVSVRSFPLFTLSFESTDFWSRFFAWVWVIIIARLRLKVKMICQGQCKHVIATRVSIVASCEYWLMAVVVGFHCDVIGAS